MAKIYPNERSVGLFKSGKKCLDVYKSVNKIENSTSLVTQKAYSVNHRLNCDDKCSIYLLTCKKCFKLDPNLDLLCIRLPPFVKIMGSFILMQNTLKRD